MSQTSTIEDKALVMLGSGTPVNVVASALGVTESRISQMLSVEEFAKAVAELKFKNLTKQTDLDDSYTDLESELLTKFRKAMPLMTNPREIAAALNIINGTKRRGAQIMDPSSQQTRIVNLTIPISIAHKFISNVNNQVVEVHDESGNASSLVTASSSSLDRLSSEVLGNKEDDPSKRLQLGSDSEALSARLAASKLVERANPEPIELKDFL